jgi:hypothetical protein
MASAEKSVREAKDIAENAAKVSKKEKVVMKTAENVLVTRDHGDDDVIRLNSDGVLLRFGSGEEFRVLPDAVTDVLSHENAKRYWVALGEHKARSRANGEKPLLEKIVDPLVGHEEARLHFELKHDDLEASKEFFKRWWLSWQFCTSVPGMEAVGYTKVTDKDPVVVGISSNASGYFMTKDTQGRDELILMKVDYQTHLQHDRAVAGKSRQAVSGARGEFEGALEKMSRGKVKPMRETEEDTTVEKVVVTRDNVDRAFLQDRR